LKLAQSIIRDGEGVTKYISVKVQQAKSKVIARAIAFTIAHSPLVKTAAFASDPNWGRILAAAGRATEEPMRVEKISLFINELNVFMHGELANSYNEKSGQKEMQKGIKQNPNDPIIIYNAACFYALIEDKKAAVKNLKRAMDNGFENYDYLRHDPDLNSLKEEPEFIAITEGK